MTAGHEIFIWMQMQHLEKRLPHFFFQFFEI
jgi:hypothetical protein